MPRYPSTSPSVDTETGGEGRRVPVLRVKTGVKLFYLYRVLDKLNKIRRDSQASKNREELTHIATHDSLLTTWMIKAEKKLSPDA